MLFILFNLVVRNVFRHKLRTLLTLVGLTVAVLAFGLLSTVVNAWYAGAEGASNARLVTRNSISLVFPLPLTYKQKIRQIDGVKAITTANWFGAAASRRALVITLSRGLSPIGTTFCSKGMISADGFLRCF